MSIFNSGANDQSAPVAPETTEAILATVTEKFKNDKGELDVAALAKGKIEADNFIERLKSEQEALRQDLNSRASLEQLLQDLKAAQQAASTREPQTPPTGPNQDGGNATALTLDAVKQLLQDELSNTQKQAIAQRNIDIAEQELSKQWGASTRAKLEARARELDVSLEFLKGLAASKPKAFLEMVGAKAPVQVHTQEFAPPTTRENPAHREAPKGRNWTYYNKLRKENPTEYWSAKVQLQEMNDAIAMGDAFNT